MLVAVRRIDSIGLAAAGRTDYSPAAMTRLPGVIAPILLALQLLLGVSDLRAQTLTTGQQGLLVLRSGDVLRGKVTRSGDRYLVATPDGGEIRLPVSVVDFPADDVHEAYRRLAERVDAGSAAQQLDLAEWCIRQQLYSEAADRLLAATVLDPQHPGIRRVETRIWLAMHPAQSAGEPAQADRPSENASVQRAIDSLPSGAIESFTSTVQPLILNRCAGCHRPGSKAPFHLLRPAHGSSLPRTFTEQNLSAILTLVDRDQPRESPLLTVPSRPHGGIDAMFGALDMEQLDGLVDWIESLSERAEAAVAQGGPVRRDAVLWQPGEMLRKMAGDQSTAAGIPRNDESRAPASERQDSGTAGESTDPFDPEVFNRRYFPN